MFDDLRGPDDQAPTATTRQMAQPGLDAINAPTIEQPALDIENTLAGKIDAHAPYTGSPDQTAELALDDLGLDLGKLEATGTGMAPPDAGEAPADAPTLVAGMDETSRELLASADASQRTEMLPITDLDLGALRLPAGSLAHLVLVPNPPHNPRGDFDLRDGRVVGAPADRLTYSGVGIIDPALLAEAAPGRFPLRPWLQKALDAGRLSGQRHDGYWLDVGTPERLADLEHHLTVCENRPNA
jgi:hypothetical protein